MEHSSLLAVSEMLEVRLDKRCLEKDLWSGQGFKAAQLQFVSVKEVSLQGYYTIPGDTLDNT